MKRLSVHVGINDYPGTDNDLNGCVNDAKDWQAKATERGFTPTLLLDRDATKVNTTEALRGLVRSLGSGDVGIFTNSSHGTWIPDLNGDESDGRDEALVCYDFPNGRSGLLVDDEIAEIVAERKRGARLLIFTDSCHSGTVVRFADFDRRPPGCRRRFMPPEAFLDGRELARAVRIAGHLTSRPRTGAILMAGCRDDEFSYDASFGGRPNGAFTRAALDTLGTGRSVREWWGLIRTKLPSEQYQQTPQLTATSAQMRYVLL